METQADLLAVTEGVRVDPGSGTCLLMVPLEPWLQIRAVSGNEDDEYEEVKKGSQPVFLGSYLYRRKAFIKVLHESLCEQVQSEPSCGSSADQKGSRRVLEELKFHPELDLKNPHGTFLIHR